MILRRAIERLRQHEWLAVMIELLIVILGMLIGIQASNWNEARVERQHQVALLEGFRADMRDYSSVSRKFARRAMNGLAAFAAARARGEHPAPYFMRFRGSDTAPKSVWEVAQQPVLTEQYLLDCASPISEVEAQAMLDGYLKDPKLLPELRFWVANQGVALNAALNFKRSLQAMIARRPARTTP